MRRESKMRSFWWAALYGGLLFGQCGAMVVMVDGCPKPGPAPGSPGVVQCGSEAVQQHWPQVLPSVNACLVDAAEGAWVNCLVGLISPVAGITEDVIACLVRDRQASFMDTVVHNPSDKRSARGAARAEEFLRTRHYQFVTP